MPQCQRLSRKGHDFEEHIAQAPDKEADDDVLDDVMRRVTMQQRVAHRGLMHEGVEGDRKARRDEQREI